MWKLNRIEITYPSLDSKINNKNASKYYALTHLNFTYDNYQLQFNFEFDNREMFSLLDFSNIKNPKILEDINISELQQILTKYNLPSFNPIITGEDINYMFFENDEDGNYDNETNIEHIKSGNYGYPISYETKYSFRDYEYTSDDKIKKDIENLIINNLSVNISKYIC